MLNDKDSSAIVAVSDLARARDFYADVLGLECIAADEGVMQFRTGATALVVYVSDFAGTNQANAVVWGVGGELEAIVATLRDKGVSFERYPGMDFSDGIHSAGDFRMVWFKDPDGNILHLNSM
ncbi:MAG TPA: VOC family protein [Devosia sp.]|jgi:catechol 2,3-dioxygenase-like lactoylglutathione lyase family enzyme|nr:VOC family protein [Devosia sp.]